MSKTIDVESIVASLDAGEIASVSANNIRNEELQTRARIRSIPRLEQALRKNSKILVPLEIALPLNPYSGEADERFNEKRKWRPLLSATTASKTLKYYANKTEALKKELCRRAGVKVEDWDTSNYNGPLSDLDIKIFRPYKVPRLMSLPVTAIRDEVVTGRDFAIQYVVNVKRNELGQLEGPMNMFLQANKFLRGMVFNEQEHIKEHRKKAINREEWKSTYKSDLQSLVGRDLATITDKDFDEAIKEVRKKITVTDDYPWNSLVVYELELNPNLGIKDEGLISEISEEDLASMARITRLSSELQAGIDSYKEGKFSETDKHYDFWELDMLCPTKDEGMSDPKRDIPKNTRYQAPVSRLADKAFYPSLVEKLQGILDDQEDLEQRFLYSSFVKPLTPEIEARIFESIALKYPLGGDNPNPWITEQLIKDNADFVSLAYGKEAEPFLAAVDAGISDLPEGQQIDHSKSLQEHEAADIATALGIKHDTDESTAGDDTPVSESEAAAILGGHSQASATAETASAPKTISLDPDED